MATLSDEQVAENRKHQEARDKERQAVIELVLLGLTRLMDDQLKKSPGKGLAVNGKILKVVHDPGCGGHFFLSIEGKDGKIQDWYINTEDGSIGRTN